MKRLIIWIWIVVLAILIGQNYPGDKVKNFFRESDSVDAVWAKLSKPCPPCETWEEKECTMYTRQSNGDTEAAYEKGQSAMHEEIVSRLVQYRTARIMYNGRPYQITVTEGEQ